jgi:acetoin utilization deacetylase AcuC-like enzyme
MSSTAFISHPTCLQHEMGEFHPESPHRIHAIQDALIQQGLADFIQKVPSQKVPINLLVKTHSHKHVDWIKQHSPSANHYYGIDDDTQMNQYSFEASLYAAGAGVVALDGIFDNLFNNAFCAIRPPGHHAVKNTAMGFCLFNNIAVAATYAKEKYNIKKVAIIDFDVHHGNGTEDIVQDDPAILFCSSYQYPFYPFSIPEKAASNCLHFPMSAGTSSTEFRQCYAERIFPKLHTFQPELILISAGFDGHISDPLAQWNLIDEDYAWVTKALMAIAKQYCDGKIVSFLEGGYSLPALSSGATAHIRELMQR